MKRDVLWPVQLMCYLWLVVAAFTTANAQESILPPVSRTYAITNATIYQSPERKLEKATVVFENGIIKNIGRQVSIPPGCVIIKGDSLHVYAGFIDGMSHVAVPKPKEDKTKKEKVKDPGNPPNDIAGIQPDRDVRDLMDASDKSVSDLRAVGFTVAHTVPHGGMLPGKGSIILLTGATADRMVYRPQVSLFSQLDGAPGVYPNTVMGVMATFREHYRQAEQARQYGENYTKNAEGMERPVSNRVLEAFYPVINKQQPVAFKGENVLDIQRVLSLRNDLGFNMILGEVKQGWDITAAIKEANAKVFLSLDLPELKEEKEKSDSAVDKTEEQSKTAVDLEKERLEARKKEMILNYYRQPSLFRNAGVKYGFSTLNSKAKDIQTILQKMVKHGLSESSALAALTTMPAELLGLSGTMGTVEPGKMANLVVTDKPYFNEKSVVKFVFVDGYQYTFEEKATKKKSDEEAADPVGKWSYKTETDQGTTTGIIEIKGEPGDYSGTITNSFNSDTNDLSNIEIDGKTLSFSFVFVAGADPLTINVEVKIDGDSFEGTMNTGQFGSFPVEAERTPEQF